MPSVTPTADVHRVVIWGTGRPRREFLHVDDLARAVLHLIRQPDPPDWVNVGTGVDQTILQVAELVAKTVGYQGQIKTDPTRPDGTPVKCTDVRRLHSLGWRHQIDLEAGLECLRVDTHPGYVSGNRELAGMTIAEAAAAMGISHATAERHWKFARSWLFAELNCTPDASE